MKTIIYEWENKHFLSQLNKTIVAIDSFNNNSIFSKVDLKTSISTNKNIDFAKLLSFNMVFLDRKAYLSLNEAVDRNPLKLKSINKKTLNSNLLVDIKFSTHSIDSLFYTYFVYLINLFKSKNISFSNNVSFIYNVKLSELNSILKVGHSYNVLDLDPFVYLSLSKNLNKYFIKLHLNNNNAY